MDFDRIIDRYYPAGTPLRDIYLAHCRSVADLALEILRRRNLATDPQLVESAAMLHDIGIFACHAPSICCHGSEPYIRHGIIGADLLRREGASEAEAAVAERHTGAGLTCREIIDANLPLPHRDFMPRTELELLICYADKFFSKSAAEATAPKPLEAVRASMARFGADSLARFDRMHAMFALQ